MDADIYQKLAARTANDMDEKSVLTMCALGLTGEAGEVADQIKKYIYHGHHFDKDAHTEELGDILWYIARDATALGLTLSGIMQKNIDKLMKRYPDGFSSEASLNRNQADTVVIEQVTNNDDEGFKASRAYKTLSKEQSKEQIEAFTREVEALTLDLKQRETD